MTSSTAKTKLTGHPGAGGTATATSETSPLRSCGVARKEPQKEPQTTPVCPKGEVGAMLKLSGGGGMGWVGAPRRGRQRGGACQGLPQMLLPQMF